MNINISREYKSFLKNKEKEEKQKRIERRRNFDYNDNEPLSSKKYNSPSLIGLMMYQEYSSHKPYFFFGRKVSPFPKSIMNLSRIVDEPILLNLSIFAEKNIEDISFGNHMIHDLDYNFSTWSFGNIFAPGSLHNYTKYYIDGYSKSPMILAREKGEKLMFPLSIYAKIKEDKSDDK